MSFSWTRVGAIFQKEIRDYRRNRFTIIFTMAVLPFTYVTLPMIQLFATHASTTSARLDTRIGLSLLYLLITPIRREEFLVGKALAVLAPTLAVAYLIFGIFLVTAALFAHPVIATAVFGRSHLLVQLLFTPLLAGWSIWVGIAISSGCADVRVAQQLSVFASLPPLLIVALMSLNVIAPTLGLAIGLSGGPPRRRRSRLAGGGDEVRPRASHCWGAKLTPS